jgi:hypothetical protein
MDWKQRGRQRRESKPAAYLLRLAQVRARKSGVPCTITEADIQIPAHCPVLGIPLKFSDGFAERNNSPSLDRRINELGYVPGNVEVISFRANSLKKNATADELERVLLWVRRLERKAPLACTREGEKRGHGAGGIFKLRGSRYWYIQFYDRKSKKAVRRSSRTEDYKQAEQLLRVSM